MLRLTDIFLHKDNRVFSQYTHTWHAALPALLSEGHCLTCWHLLPGFRSTSIGCVGRRTPSNGLLTSYRFWRKRWRREAWGISSPINSIWPDGIKAMYVCESVLVLLKAQTKVHSAWVWLKSPPFPPLHFVTGWSRDGSLWSGQRCDHWAQTENLLRQTCLGQGVWTSPQREPHVRYSESWL